MNRLVLIKYFAVNKLLDVNFYATLINANGKKKEIKLETAIQFWKFTRLIISFISFIL